MKKGRNKNSGIVLVVGALLFLSTVNALAFDTQQRNLTKMEIHRTTNSMPIVHASYMEDVQISSDPLDEEHPTIADAADGSILVAYDREPVGIEGHIYFMRSTDDGNTWSEIWNTDTEVGGMTDSVQDWPVLCRPPGGEAIYGSWNDEPFNVMFYASIANPSDPNSYGEQVVSDDMTGWDYDRHTFTIDAFDTNRYAVGHVGHIEFGGYDLPFSCQITYSTEGFTPGGRTGDEDYPIGYNCEVAVTSTLFWMVWDFPSEATGTSGLLLKWGDPLQETDCHYWPDREITSSNDYFDPAFDASGDNLCIVYMTNDNDGGDFDLACMFSTDEGDTWEDSTLPSQPQVDEKSPEIFVSGSTVFCTFVRNGNLYLTKSTDLGKTWEEPEQINEVEGTVVDEPGAVEVSQVGIVWADTRNGNKDVYFAPLGGPIISVESISGGMGVTATITNTGTGDAADVPWSIDVSGLVFLGGHTEGTIDLPAGGETTIKSGLVFGIGPGAITVTVGGASKAANCFILGPLVLGVT